MMDLEKDSGVVLQSMDGVRQPLQSSGLLPEDKTDLSNIPFAFGGKVSPLHKNQPHSPLRPCSVMVNQFIRDQTIFRGVVHRHLGHGQTIFDGKAPDFAGLKNRRITHFLSFSSPILLTTPLKKV
jgi:hypothetical protein